MTATMMTLERRDPRKLKNHPINIKIYGDTPDPEFVAKVKKAGRITTPIVILGNDTVVEGHRRRQAAILNDIKEVPVIVRRDLADPLDIEEAVILGNTHRDKTTEQKAREYERLKEIEAERAKARQQATQATPGHPVVGISHNRKTSEKTGRASEIAAEKVGLSRKTAEKAVEVVKEIDKAKNNGHPEKAEELRETLNKNVTAAHRIIAPEKPTTKATRKQSAAELFKPLLDSIGRCARECDAVAKKSGGQGAHHKKVIGFLDKAMEAARDWKGDC